METAAGKIALLQRQLNDLLQDEISKQKRLFLEQKHKLSQNQGQDQRAKLDASCPHCHLVGIGLSLSHDFEFVNCVDAIEFTNFVEGFVGCLDWILAEKACFKPEGQSPMPSVEELTANKALPSLIFPSDHISIAADLKFVA